MSQGRIERFEEVDWDDFDLTGGVRRWWRIPALLAGWVPLGAGLARQQFTEWQPPFFEPLAPLDWLLAMSLYAIGLFAVLPLIRNPRETRRYWKRLRRHRFGLPAFVFIIGFSLVGLLGPLFVTEPTLTLERSYQPPVGTTVSMEWIRFSCIGEVSDGICHGTWKYPFGTTQAGRNVLTFVVLGTRTALMVSVVSVTVLVPTGVGIGLLSATFGGYVDSILMRVAEILQTVPAVIVYLFFWQWNQEFLLLSLIAVFGLTNWGGLARLVRNESLELRDTAYVQAAVTSGASNGQIIRRHLLPNVSRSVFANVALQVPLLIITEAALSFLVLPVPNAPGPVSLGDPSIYSWGQLFYVGIREDGFFPGWWVATVPAVALILTSLAFHVFGRVLSHVLDPRPS
jgi:peptide/nickel transport system permease protein